MAYLLVVYYCVICPEEAVYTLRSSVHLVKDYKRCSGHGVMGHVARVRKRQGAGGVW